MSTEDLVAWGLPTLGLVLWCALVGLALPRLVTLVAGPALGPRRRRWAWPLFGCLVLVGLWGWLLLAPFDTPAHAFVVERLQPWAWGTIAVGGLVIGALVLVRRSLDFVRKKAETTETALDDVLILAVRRPAHVLILLAGFALWVDLVPAPAALTTRVGTVAEAAAIVVVVLFVDAVLAQVIERRRATSRVFATAGTVLRTMARALLFIVGFLMVLGAVGIDVTPVAASLGVGSLAIGLALQSTLEDFIAGLLIAADQPVSVGDFVELGSEQLAGTVTAIGWRTTRILTLNQTKVIVPNQTLARATVVNRSRPSSTVRFQPQVGVHYSSDLAAVARAVHEVASALQAEHPKATRDFQPLVTFFRFGDSSVDLKVWLEAVDWVGHFELHDAFIRAAHARFRADGIVIPFPIRTLELPPALEAALARSAGAPPTAR